MCRVCKNMKTKPIHISDMQDISGFAASNYLGGEEAKLLVRAYFDSDEPDFHKYIKRILSLFLQKPYFSDNVNNILILRHEDDSGDIYINNVPISIEIMSKKDLKGGEPVSENDIADVSKVHFENISIKQKDKIVFCFRRA